MIRLFVEAGAFVGNRVVLTKDQVHHVVRVSRLEVGESIELVVDRKTQVVAEVLSVEKDSLKLKVIRESDVVDLKPFRLVLVQCLPKQDKLSDILRSCTELGVDLFVPVMSRRTVPVVDKESTEKKRLRWAKVIESACEQSAQIRIPEVLPVQKLEAIAWATLFPMALKLVAWEGESEQTLKQVLNRAETPSEVVVVVGPEGGLHEDEIAGLKRQGFESVSLGKTILRVEHAGFLVCGQVLYQLG